MTPSKALAQFIPYTFVYDVEVGVTGERAEAVFDAVLLGSNNTLPENASVFEVVTRWEKQDEWLLVDIQWQRKIIELPELPAEVRKWFEQ